MVTPRLSLLTHTLFAQRPKNDGGRGDRRRGHHQDPRPHLIRMVQTCRSRVARIMSQFGREGRDPIKSHLRQPYAPNGMPCHDSGVAAGESARYGWQVDGREEPKRIHGQF
jgi:hypothetical protein